MRGVTHARERSRREGEKFGEMEMEMTFTSERANTYTHTHKCTLYNYIIKLFIKSLE